MKYKGLTLAISLLIPFILYRQKITSYGRFGLLLCKAWFQSKKRLENKSETIKEKMIKIEYGDYHVFLPYDATKISDMIFIKVVGEYEDGSKIDLTQEPGVLYCFSASDLGLSSIIVYNSLYDTKDIYRGNTLISSVF